MEKEQKILVIDDNVFILNLVKEVLRIPNSRLLTTACGNEGYELACKELPDAIILDRRLKGQNGHDVLRKIKNNPLTQNIPVTMVSGDDKQSQIEGSIAHGAEDYIVKPFSIKTLKDKVERMLRIGSLYDERFYYVKKGS